MPNPPSPNRQYYRFKAGEKPTESNLNTSFVDKLDTDIDILFDNIAVLESTDTTITNRLDQFSDVDGNLTVAAPEFSLVDTPATFVAGNQFTLSGDFTDEFRANGKIQAILSGNEPIAVVDTVTYNGVNTVVTLASSILDGSLTQVRRSHVLDSFPRIDGGVDIKLASITADRLAPGVGSTSSFADDVSVNKANARLFLNATTGNPKLDLYSVAGATANRRRILQEIEFGTNLFAVKRLTDSGTTIDSIATANLVSGAWDFPQGISLGSSRGNAVGTANAETISGVKTFSSFPVKSGSTTPTVSGEFATKDYVDAILNQPRVKVFRASDVNVPTATATTISWGNEEYDYQSMHEGITNPTRLTVPTGQGGLYLVIFQLRWDTTANQGQREIRITKNGAVVARILQHSLTGTMIQNAVTEVEATAGQYFEAVVVQSSGANLLALAANTFFSARRVAI